MLFETLRAWKIKLNELPDLFVKLFGVIGNLLQHNKKEDLLTLGEKLKFNKRNHSINDIGHVEIVTPEWAHCMTTFFDLDPISPNKRFLCVTKVPFINRIPVPGDIAQVCIIDLVETTIFAVHNTSGWGAQLGSNVQWLDDEHVICNDLIDGKDVSIKVNIQNLQTTKFNKPIYGLSPCRKFSYSPNLFLVNAILPGYGMPEGFTQVLRQKERLSDTEGIWQLDLDTGNTSLFMSIKDILNSIDCEKDFLLGKNYIFNVKVSDSGKFLFAVIFAKEVPFRAGRVLQLVVVEIKTKKVVVVVPDELWRKGGHHPSWVKGKDAILMNLKLDNEELKFVEIDIESLKYEVKSPTLKGGGHPSFSPNGKLILTDAYTSEGFMDENGEVPIRLIKPNNDEEVELCRIFTNKMSGARRVDPHPVWSDNNHIVFNGVSNHKRMVFLAKLDNSL